MHDLIERHSPKLEYLVRAMDVMLILSAGKLAALLRFSEGMETLAPVHGTLLYFCCALAFVVLPQFDVYSSWRGRSLWLMAGNAAIAMLVIIGAGVAFAFLVRQIDELSRMWMM